MRRLLQRESSLQSAQSLKPGRRNEVQNGREEKWESYQILIPRKGPPCFRTTLGGLACSIYVHGQVGEPHQSSAGQAQEEQVAGPTRRDLVIPKARPPGKSE